jgi:pyruvate kinase
MKKMVSPKTKIVCTIGPASESPEVMKPMMEAGMNVARLNFSHGEFAAHKRVIENLRAASASIGLRIAIMADLSGPKMRIGKFASEPVDLETGDQFTLTADDVEGDKRRVSVSFARLPQSVKPGDTLFLNDGYIQLEVNRVAGNDVICVVKVGGELRSRKGLNLPGIDLGISAFTERDHECLKFALENGQPILRRKGERYRGGPEGGFRPRLRSLHHRENRTIGRPRPYRRDHCGRGWHHDREG